MRGGTPDRGKKQKGYTIVEVLIFVAISGFMFVIAAAYVNGKQASAEFKQGISQANSSLRAVMNDVSNGFFPSLGDFRCTAGGSGAPAFSATATGQGENLGCIYLGKVIQFAPDGDTARYNVFTLAGRQYKPSTTQNEVPTNLAEAMPVVVPGLTQTYNFEHGNRLVKAGTVIEDSLGAHSDLSGIAFLTSFGRYDTGTRAGLTGANLSSGNQSVIAVPIFRGFGITTAEMTSRIATDVTDANVDTNPAIRLCFDGGSGWHGVLSIGGAGGHAQRLATTVQVSKAATGAICPIP